VSSSVSTDFSDRHLPYLVCPAFHPRTSKQPSHSLQSSTSEATGCITNTSPGIREQLSVSWACCRSTSHSRILCPRAMLCPRERKWNTACRSLELRLRTSCGTAKRCLRMGCLSMLFERRRVRQVVSVKRLIEELENSPSRCSTHQCIVFCGLGTILGRMSVQ
jgi:hypothetical protein